MSTATPLKPVAMTEFEAWVQTRPDARFWNTLDAMQAAWVAAKALPSPAWCASVDAELAATAEADARYGTLVDAVLQVIEFQRNEARDRYGNAAKAESWACVKFLRTALADTGVPTTTLPAAAVAEGAQLDGESLDPSE